MGAINFFINWQLWQQMTFVLACSIVLVFFAGLMKLWWINHSVRKHELLDEEKQSRMSEIEKTGIHIRKRANIPFGVRAIQSGIEVDGIWISRPGTPNSQSPSPLAGSTLTLATDPERYMKGKAKMTSGSVSPIQYTTPSESTVEPDSPPAQSPVLGPQTTYRPKHAPVRSSARVSEIYNAGNGPQRAGSPGLQTYVPTNSYSRSPAPSRQSTRMERTSTSSEEAYATPRQSSMGNHPRSKSPFPDAKAARQSYVPTDRRTRERAVESPEGGQSRERSDTSPPRPSDGNAAAMRRPMRSYSGETHVNRASRRVNAGFEVLPAGTFGTPAEPPADLSDVDLERAEGTRSSRYSRSTANRLQKRDRSHSRSK